MTIVLTFLQGGEEVFHQGQVHGPGLHRAVLQQQSGAVQRAGAGHRLAQPSGPAPVLCRGDPARGRAH